MSIRAPNASLPEFGLVISNATSVSPGAVVTPGNNTYGAYTQLLSGAQVTDTAYGFWVNVNSLAVSGAPRDALAKVAIDRAGGASYLDIASDLLVSCAGSLSGVGLGGIWYWIPLLIPAGSSVALAASVNNATVGTCSSFVRLMCKPTSLTPPRTASFMRSFGITPATSSGTAIVPNGAGGRSAYVQVGSALTESLWYWCIGAGCNNAAMSNNATTFDLAVGSSTTVNRLIVTEQTVIPTTAEVLGYTSQGAYGLAAINENVYIRAGGQAVFPTGASCAAYGFGG